MVEKDHTIFDRVIGPALLVASRPSAEVAIEVSIGGKTRHFTRDVLLARPDVTSIEVARDVAYGKAIRFRAIPVATLLAGFDPPVDSVIETIALDGFAAQLPLYLLTDLDPANAVAWLAIEPADALWPPLPGKTESAGPFYILWTGAAAGRSAANSGHIK